MIDGINIIQLYSSILVLIGSFYLCRAVLIAHPKLIALQSRTYIGGNKYILEGLIRQQTDSIVGFVTLLIGTVVGIISVFVIENYPLTAALKVSGILTVVTLLIAEMSAKIVYRRRYHLTNLFAFSEHIKDYLVDRRIRDFDPAKATQSAEHFDYDRKIISATEPYELILAVFKSCGEHEAAQKVEAHRKSRIQ